MEVTYSQEADLSSKATAKFDSNLFWKYFSCKVTERTTTNTDSQVLAKLITMHDNVYCFCSPCMMHTFP